MNGKMKSSKWLVIVFSVFIAYCGDNGDAGESSKKPDNNDDGKTNNDGGMNGDLDAGGNNEPSVAARISPDCTPTDGETYVFTIGIDDAECKIDVPENRPWIKITTARFTGMPPAEEQIYEIPYEIDYGAVYFPDGGSKNGIQSAQGTLSVRPPEHHGKIPGTYSLRLLGGEFLHNKFEAVLCSGHDQCPD